MRVGKLLLATILASTMLSPLTYAQQSAAAAPKPAATAQQPLAAVLPADELALFKKAAGQIRRNNAPLRAQVRKLRQELSAIVTADKFDKNAFIAKTGEIQKISAQMYNNWVSGTAAFLAKLTPAERQALQASKARIR